MSSNSIISSSFLPCEAKRDREFRSAYTASIVDRMCTLPKCIRDLPNPILLKKNAPPPPSSALLISDHFTCNIQNLLTNKSDTIPLYKIFISQFYGSSGEKIIKFELVGRKNHEILPLEDKIDYFTKVGAGALCTDWVIKNWLRKGKDTDSRSTTNGPISSKELDNIVLETLRCIAREKGLKDFNKKKSDALLRELNIKEIPCGKDFRLLECGEYDIAIGTFKTFCLFGDTNFHVVIAPKSITEACNELEIRIESEGGNFLSALAYHGLRVIGPIGPQIRDYRAFINAMMRIVQGEAMHDFEAFAIYFKTFIARYEVNNEWPSRIAEMISNIVGHHTDNKQKEIEALIFLFEEVLLLLDPDRKAIPKIYLDKLWKCSVPKKDIANNPCLLLRGHYHLSSELISAIHFTVGCLVAGSPYQTLKRNGPGYRIKVTRMFDRPMIWLKHTDGTSLIVNYHPRSKLETIKDEYLKNKVDESALENILKLIHEIFYANKMFGSGQSGFTREKQHLTFDQEGLIEECNNLMDQKDPFLQIVGTAYLMLLASLDDENAKQILLSKAVPLIATHSDPRIRNIGNTLLEKYLWLYGDKTKLSENNWQIQMLSQSNMQDLMEVAVAAFTPELFPLAWACFRSVIQQTSDEKVWTLLLQFCRSAYLAFPEEVADLCTSEGVVSNWSSLMLYPIACSGLLFPLAEVLGERQSEKLASILACISPLMLTDAQKARWLILGDLSYLPPVHLHDYNRLRSISFESTAEGTLSSLRKKSFEEAVAALSRVLHLTVTEKDHMRIAAILKAWMPELIGSVNDSACLSRILTWKGYRQPTLRTLHVEHLLLWLEKVASSSTIDEPVPDAIPLIILLLQTSNSCELSATVKKFIFKTLQLLINLHPEKIHLQYKFLLLLVSHSGMGTSMGCQLSEIISTLLPVLLRSPFFPTDNITQLCLHPNVFPHLCMRENAMELFLPFLELLASEPNRSNRNAALQICHRIKLTNPSVNLLGCWLGFIRALKRRGRLEDQSKHQHSEWRSLSTLTSLRLISAQLSIDSIAEKDTSWESLLLIFSRKRPLHHLQKSQLQKAAGLLVAESSSAEELQNHAKWILEPFCMDALGLNHWQICAYEWLLKAMPLNIMQTGEMLFTLSETLSHDRPADSALYEKLCNGLLENNILSCLSNFPADFWKALKRISPYINSGNIAYWEALSVTMSMRLKHTDPLLAADILLHPEINKGRQLQSVRLIIPAVITFLLSEPDCLAKAAQLIAAYPTFQGIGLWQQIWQKLESAPHSNELEQVLKYWQSDVRHRISNCSKTFDTLMIVIRMLLENPKSLYCHLNLPADSVLKACEMLNKPCTDLFPFISELLAVSFQDSSQEANFNAQTYYEWMTKHFDNDHRIKADLKILRQWLAAKELHCLSVLKESIRNLSWGLHNYKLPESTDDNQKIMSFIYEHADLWPNEDEGWQSDLLTAFACVLLYVFAACSQSNHWHKSTKVLSWLCKHKDLFAHDCLSEGPSMQAHYLFYELLYFIIKRNNELRQLFSQPPIYSGVLAIINSGVEQTVALMNQTCIECLQILMQNKIYPLNELVPATEGAALFLLRSSLQEPDASADKYEKAWEFYQKKYLTLPLRGKNHGLLINELQKIVVGCLQNPSRTALLQKNSQVLCQELFSNVDDCGPMIRLLSELNRLSPPADDEKQKLLHAAFQVLLDGFRINRLPEQLIELLLNALKKNIFALPRDVSSKNRQRTIELYQRVVSSGMLIEQSDFIQEAELFLFGIDEKDTECRLQTSKPCLLRLIDSIFLHCPDNASALIDVISACINHPAAYPLNKAEEVECLNIYLQSAIDHQISNWIIYAQLIEQTNLSRFDVQEINSCNRTLVESLLLLHKKLFYYGCLLLNNDNSFYEAHYLSCNLSRNTKAFLSFPHDQIEIKAISDYYGISLKILIDTGIEIARNSSQRKDRFLTVSQLLNCFQTLINPAFASDFAFLKDTQFRLTLYCHFLTKLGEEEGLKKHIKATFELIWEVDPTLNRLPFLFYNYLEPAFHDVLTAAYASFHCHSEDIFTYQIQQLRVIKAGHASNAVNIQNNLDTFLNAAKFIINIFDQFTNAKINAGTMLQVSGLLKEVCEYLIKSKNLEGAQFIFGQLLTSAVDPWPEEEDETVYLEILSQILDNTSLDSIFYFQKALNKGLFLRRSNLAPKSKLAAKAIQRLHLLKDPVEMDQFFKNKLLELSEKASLQQISISYTLLRLFCPETYVKAWFDVAYKLAKAGRINDSFILLGYTPYETVPKEDYQDYLATLANQIKEDSLDLLRFSQFFYPSLKLLSMLIHDPAYQSSIWTITLAFIKQQTQTNLKFHDQAVLNIIQSTLNTPLRESLYANQDAILKYFEHCSSQSPLIITSLIADLVIVLQNYQLDIFPWIKLLSGSLRSDIEDHKDVTPSLALFMSTDKFTLILLKLLEKNAYPAFFKLFPIVVKNKLISMEDTKLKKAFDTPYNTMWAKILKDPHSMSPVVSTLFIKSVLQRSKYSKSISSYKKIEELIRAVIPTLPVHLHLQIAAACFRCRTQQLHYYAYELIIAALSPAKPPSNNDIDKIIELVIVEKCLKIIGKKRTQYLYQIYEKLHSLSCIDLEHKRSYYLDMLTCTWMETASMDYSSAAFSAYMNKSSRFIKYLQPKKELFITWVQNCVDSLVSFYFKSSNPSDKTVLFNQIKIFATLMKKEVKIQKHSQTANRSSIKPNSLQLLEDSKIISPASLPYLSAIYSVLEGKYGEDEIVGDIGEFFIMELAEQMIKFFPSPFAVTAFLNISFSQNTLESSPKLFAAYFQSLFSRKEWGVFQNDNRCHSFLLYLVAHEKDPDPKGNLLTYAEKQKAFLELFHKVMKHPKLHTIGCFSRLIRALQPQVLLKDDFLTYQLVQKLVFSVFISYDNDKLCTTVIEELLETILSSFCDSSTMQINLLNFLNAQILKTEAFYLAEKNTNDPFPLIGPLISVTEKLNRSSSWLEPSKKLLSEAVILKYAK